MKEVCCEWTVVYFFEYDFEKEREDFVLQISDDMHLYVTRSEIILIYQKNGRIWHELLYILTYAKKVNILMLNVVTTVSNAWYVSVLQKQIAIVSWNLF